MIKTTNVPNGFFLWKIIIKTSFDGIVSKFNFPHNVFIILISSYFTVIIYY